MKNSSYFFVTFREDFWGGSLFLNKLFSDGKIRRNGFYKNLNYMVESHLPSITFDAASINIDANWAAKSWSVGFSSTLQLQDSSSLTRTKEIGSIAPFILAKSCIKRNIWDGGAEVADVSNTFTVESIDSADPLVALSIEDCAGCTYTQGQINVADLQVNKLLAMTDMCSATSFIDVTQINDPIIPDLCPIDLNQSSVALDITMP